MVTLQECEVVYQYIPNIALFKYLAIVWSQPLPLIHEPVDPSPPVMSKRSDSTSDFLCIIGEYVGLPNLLGGNYRSSIWYRCKV